MKKKLLDIFIILLSLITAYIYLYYFRPLTDDEIFNYGFSVNILNGLIPYKDFNMIVMPFFSYFLALIIWLFGKNLFVYHLVISGIISVITYICYRKIGYKAIIIFLLLLVYPYTGYNMFCLLLLFILLIFTEKNRDFLEAVIISIMFLTKQSLVILIIPSIIFSKDKKRIISVYFIFFLLMLLYLIINDSIWQCIDYCFLGMFNFVSGNGTGTTGFLLLELLLIGYLSYLYVKYRNKVVFYLLLFQIITFPIVNYYHFIIGFIPIIYYLLIRFNKCNLFTMFSFVSVITFFFLLNFGILVNNDNYKYLYHYNVSNFMKDRFSSMSVKYYIDIINEKNTQYSDYTMFIFSNYSYLIKLNLNIPINKYDIINNGNMGYNGSNRYIEEVDNYCKKNKCIFFVGAKEMEPDSVTQTNKEILLYVDEHYKEIVSSNIFNVYISDVD